MAITGANRVTLYQLFGIPRGGSGYQVGALATLYGPFAEVYDFSAVVTALDAKCAGVDSDQQTLVETQLTRLAAIGFTSPVQIYTGSGGSQGVLADHPRERESIRQEIAKIIGFDCPAGGFMAKPPHRGFVR